MYETPLIQVRKYGPDGRKFDSLEWNVKFSTYLVYAFQDGSIFPIARTEWSIDTQLGTTFIEENGNDYEEFGERHPVTLSQSGLSKIYIIGGAQVLWDGTVQKGAISPGGLEGPSANEILQAEDLP